MAEQAKLTAISKAWSNKDKEDFAKGMTGSGTLTPPETPKKVIAPEMPAQAGETEEEAAVPAMQAANAKTPGAQDKLNMMAKARAKFYGEGI